MFFRRDLILSSVAQNAKLPLNGQEYMLSINQHKHLALNPYLEEEIVDVLAEDTHLDVAFNLSTSPLLQNKHIEIMLNNQIQIIDFFTENMFPEDERFKIIYRNIITTINLIQHSNISLETLFTAVKCKNEDISSLAFSKYMGSA
jgi:hypothetical protein